MNEIKMGPGRSGFI